ncbi:hypothetical protein BUALT_Bualt09G0116200 [Buddleja alternifolia]|uniref:C2H2-type domain-containing protein n=1 Tax=Buddleja alternifolia TaxID=168488 RepID=A0AAV6X9X7_9LAMI|nr:hypothetical protein BUALT_Bualt09G0116200 [Buddleja alternifolia]
MEQARYWMWAKRKPDPNPRILAPAASMNSYGDSWEEQAFAEDAAGSLGGCVWPPRSYSCSFCRREFRSAQALGGHMNVHRRDRARMKQSPIPPTEIVPQDHGINTCTSFDAPYSSQICNFLYTNPNPDFSDTGPLVSAPSRFIRVSSPPSKKINSEEIKTSTLSFFSPVVQKNNKDDIVSSHPSSWSSFVAEKRNRASDLIKNDEEKKSAIFEAEARAEKDDCVTEDLSISLNLVSSGTQTKTSSNDVEEVASCKRRRIEANPSSSFPKLSAVDRCLPQSEAFKLRSGSVEELDLELRLGCAPKVK